MASNALLEQFRTGFPFAFNPDDSEQRAARDGDPLWLNATSALNGSAQGPEAIDAHALEVAATRHELLDYWGRTSQAAEWLDTTVPWRLVEQAMESDARWEDELKNRWTLVGLGHLVVAYRAEDYAKAERILKTLRSVASRHINESPRDSQHRTWLGTRARIAYWEGQVARQQHEDARARQAFGEAVALAANRLIAKTHENELHGLKERPPAAGTYQPRQLMANGTTGKCLIGLGLMSMGAGSLVEARTHLCAAVSALRGTLDIVHRAYATLLMSAVERATVRNDDDTTMRVARQRLVEAARALRDHGVYRLRANYEVALAFYRAPSNVSREELAEALKRLNTGLDVTGRTGTRSRKWQSAVLVLESRLARTGGPGKPSLPGAIDAHGLAKLAFSALDDTPYFELRAEALVAQGEALVAQTEFLSRDESNDALSRAIEAFRSAARHGRDNRKVFVVAHLHLADAYLRRFSNGDQAAMSDARTAYARVQADGSLALVEHGFVLELARSIDSRLRHAEAFVLDESGLDGDWHRHMQALQAFLIRRAQANGMSEVDIAHRLELKPASLSKLKRRLTDLGLQAGLKPVGRPRRRHT